MSVFRQAQTAALQTNPASLAPTINDGATQVPPFISIDAGDAWFVSAHQTTPVLARCHAACESTSRPRDAASLTSSWGTWLPMAAGGTHRGYVAAPQDTRRKVVDSRGRHGRNHQCVALAAGASRAMQRTSTPSLSSGDGPSSSPRARPTRSMLCPASWDSYLEAPGWHRPAAQVGTELAAVVLLATACLSRRRRRRRRRPDPRPHRHCCDCPISVPHLLCAASAHVGSER